MKENVETMLKKINDITEKMATKDCINNLLDVLEEANFVLAAILKGGKKGYHQY